MGIGLSVYISDNINLIENPSSPQKQSRVSLKQHQVPRNNSRRKVSIRPTQDKKQFADQSAKK